MAIEASGIDVRLAARWQTFALRVAVALTAVIVLLIPALWNGFPILEYDTGGYLARWYEGYLVPSRSTVYGLFLTAGWPLDFWPIVVLQSASAVWVIAWTLRAFGLGGRPILLLVLVSVLSATTALSWNASMLLTDIFAGLGVLAFYLFVFKSEYFATWERIALGAFIGFAGSTHSATFLVLVGLSVIVLLTSFIRSDVLPRARAVNATAAVAFGALLLLAGNYFIAKRIAWTPGGFGIVFGRMLEDGLVTRFLDEHCPDPRFRLCAYRKELPRTADDFLWGESVFDKLGRFDGLGDEMRTIVLESIVAYPFAQIETALAAAAKQLVKVRTGEGVVVEIWHTFGIMEHYTPSVMPAMRAARQQHGELHFDAVNLIHVPVAYAGMIALPILMFLALRRKISADLGLLAATAALAIVFNACICGPLSNAHDRYGARIVWIAPFVLTLVPFQRMRRAAADLRPVVAA